MGTSGLIESIENSVQWWYWDIGARGRRLDLICSMCYSWENEFNRTNLIEQDLCSPKTSKKSNQEEKTTSNTSKSSGFEKLKSMRESVRKDIMAHQRIVVGTWMSVDACLSLCGKQDGFLLSYELPWIFMLALTVCCYGCRQCDGRQCDGVVCFHLTSRCWNHLVRSSGMNNDILSFVLLSLMCLLTCLLTGKSLGYFYGFPISESFEVWGLWLQFRFRRHARKKGFL